MRKIEEVDNQVNLSKYLTGEDHDAWGPLDLLHCPICIEYNEAFNKPTYVGYNVHLKKPYVVDGQDSYKAWKGRGNLVVIPAYCEADHEFEICFGFHKGQTFAFIR